MQIKKFFIEWCAPCMAVTIVLSWMDLDWIELVEVNMSDGKIQDEMISLYNLKNIPTLIFTENWKELWRLSWYISKEEIESFIN